MLGMHISSTSRCCSQWRSRELVDARHRHVSADCSPDAPRNAPRLRHDARERQPLRGKRRFRSVRDRGRLVQTCLGFLDKEK
eukprot:1848283-Pleurochrysis_carterae.AAC.1